MTTHHEPNTTFASMLAGCLQANPTITRAEFDRRRQAPCAGEGVGYWECDTPGGCTDCRNLAISLNDHEQFACWGADLDALADVYRKKAELSYATSDRLALIVS
jgi:hypothetical protein